MFCRLKLFLVFILFVIGNLFSVNSNLFTNSTYSTILKTQLGTKVIFKEFQNNNSLIIHNFYFGKKSDPLYKPDSFTYKLLADTLFIKNNRTKKTYNEFIDILDTNILSFSIINKDYFSNAIVFKKVTNTAIKKSFLEFNKKQNKIKIFPSICPPIDISFLSIIPDTQKINGIWLDNGMNVLIDSNLNISNNSISKIKNNLKNNYLNQLKSFITFDITNNISGPAKLPYTINKVLSLNKILFVFSPKSIEVSKISNKLIKLNCIYSIINVNNKSIKFMENLTIYYDIPTGISIEYFLKNNTINLAEYFSKSFDTKN